MVSSDHRRSGFIRDSKPEDQLFIVHFSDAANSDCLRTALSQPVSRSSGPHS
jgi:hypothetical protein